MTQDKFIIKNGAVIESVLAGETVFDVQKTDKSSILGINSNGTINLIGDINPSGNFINKLKISNGGISVTGVTTGETIFYDSAGGIVLRGRNTGDQDLSNLSTYDYVDQTFLKLAGGTMTGSLYVNNTTNSTSTTTGAIRTSGGIGVVGNANFGGIVTTSAIQTTNTDTYSLILRNGGGNALYVQQSSTSMPDIASFRYGSATAGAGTQVLGVSSAGINVTGTATISSTVTAPTFTVSANNLITTNGGYLGLRSVGDEITIGGSTEMYVNYRPALGATPTNWRWMVGDLINYANFFIGNLTAKGYVEGSRFCTGYDTGIANSISCSGWFRSNGTSGWVNNTYGGGINMTDTTYVRVYNDKAFKVTSTASDSINTDGGVLASGDINVSGVVGFGTNKCQMLYNSTENSIDFIIN